MGDTDFVAVVSWDIEGVPISSVYATVVPASELESVIGRPVVEVVDVDCIALTRSSVGT